MSMSVFTQCQKLLSLAQGQQQCLLCYQSSKQLICHYCRSDLNLFDLKSCHYNLLNRQTVYSHLEPPRYQRLLALAPYQWPISQLISELKFSQKLVNAKALGHLFSRHCLPATTRSIGSKDTALIPMPLHSSRFKERRYNQSLEIVRHLSLDRAIWQREYCQRQTKTDAQTQLTAAQRHQNVNDAFTLAHPLNKHRVIIFDDVVTTGATVNSLCKTLLATNPNLTIEVWCTALTLGY